MTEYRLGRAIAQLVPYIRHRQQLEEKPLITNKILLLFGIIAVIKIVALTLQI